MLGESVLEEGGVHNEQINDFYVAVFFCIDSSFRTTLIG